MYGFQASFPWGFLTIFFFYGVGLLTSRPTPQPGGPAYLFLSGSSPLTCLAWEALPVALRYRQQSSRDYMTTKAPPLRQSRDTFGGIENGYVIWISLPSPCERAMAAVRTDVKHRARIRETLINLRSNKLARAATLLPVLCVLFFSYFLPPFECCGTCF